jgi:epoxyqueuosine reductase
MVAVTDASGQVRVSLPQISGISYPLNRHGSQEVCPWNGPKFVSLTRQRNFDGREREWERKRERERGGTAQPGTTVLSLISLMRMSYEDWDSWTRGSAMRRAGYAGFRRNVAVRLGNWGSEEAVPVLVEALSDAEPLVRGHAAWALGEIGSPEALAALGASLNREREAFVLEEVEAALRAYPPVRPGSA